MRYSAIFHQEKLLLAFAFGSLAFLAASYIFQVNAFTQSLYTISRQEESAKKLHQESRTLEANTMGSSFGDVEELAALSRFEKVNSVSYVRLFEKAVARNTTARQ